MTIDSLRSQHRRFIYQAFSYQLTKVGLEITFDFLLEPMNISRMLFEELHDKPISPKGLRILGKTNLLERHTIGLIKMFKKLDKILLASDEELLEVLGNEGLVTFFKDEIYNLRERISVGKRI